MTLLPPPQHQRDVIAPLLLNETKDRGVVPRELVEGEAMYVVSRHWWELWCHYVGACPNTFPLEQLHDKRTRSNSPPSTIKQSHDNVPPTTLKPPSPPPSLSYGLANLCLARVKDPAGVCTHSHPLSRPQYLYILRPDIEEGKDFELLPMNVFYQLALWYPDHDLGTITATATAGRETDRPSSSTPALSSLSCFNTPTLQAPSSLSSSSSSSLSSSSPSSPTPSSSCIDEYSLLKHVIVRYVRTVGFLRELRVDMHPMLISVCLSGIDGHPLHIPGCIGQNHENVMSTDQLNPEDKTRTNNDPWSDREPSDVPLSASDMMWSSPSVGLVEIPSWETVSVLPQLCLDRLCPKVLKRGAIDATSAVRFWKRTMVRLCGVGKWKHSDPSHDNENNMEPCNGEWVMLGTLDLVCPVNLVIDKVETRLSEYTTARQHDKGRRGLENGHNTDEEGDQGVMGDGQDERRDEGRETEIREVDCGIVPTLLLEAKRPLKQVREYYSSRISAMGEAEEMKGLRKRGLWNTETKSCGGDGVESLNKGGDEGPNAGEVNKQITKTNTIGSEEESEPCHTPPVIIQRMRHEGDDGNDNDDMQMVWTRTEPPRRDWRDFRVGDLVDCRDREGVWYESLIRDVNEAKGTVHVHFLGWEVVWDEHVDINSDRLAARNTHTKGAFVSPEVLTMKERKSVRSSPIARGVVGLVNLGNTCYLNTTAQCLLAAPVLTPFFATGQYARHVSRRSRMGWQGRIADEWGSVVRDAWSGDFSTIAPVALKQAIAELQPRFSGYEQHDASEVLAFLLDGLHEDMNRARVRLPTAVSSSSSSSSTTTTDTPPSSSVAIRDLRQSKALDQGRDPSTQPISASASATATTPPITPPPSSSSMPRSLAHDHASQTTSASSSPLPTTPVLVGSSIAISPLVAESVQLSNDSWLKYRSTNDSPLVDACHGQLRSLVTCMKCGHHSATFDPFSILSLPLPDLHSVLMEVIFIDLTESSTLAFSLSSPTYPFSAISPTATSPLLLPPQLIHASVRQSATALDIKVALSQLLHNQAPLDSHSSSLSPTQPSPPFSSPSVSSQHSSLTSSTVSAESLILGVCRGRRLRRFLADDTPVSTIAFDDTLIAWHCPLTPFPPTLSPTSVVSNPAGSIDPTSSSSSSSEPFPHLRPESLIIPVCHTYNSFPASFVSLLPLPLHLASSIPISTLYLALAISSLPLLDKAWVSHLFHLATSASSPLRPTSSSSTPSVSSAYASSSSTSPVLEETALLCFRAFASDFFTIYITDASGHRLLFQVPEQPQSMPSPSTLNHTRSETRIPAVCLDLVARRALWIAAKDAEHARQVDDGFSVDVSGCAEDNDSDAPFGGRSQGRSSWWAGEDMTCWPPKEGKIDNIDVSIQGRGSFGSHACQVGRVGRDRSPEDEKKTEKASGMDVEDRLLDPRTIGSLIQMQLVWRKNGEIVHRLRQRFTSIQQDQQDKRIQVVVTREGNASVSLWERFMYKVSSQLSFVLPRSLLVFFAAEPPIPITATPLIQTSIEDKDVSQDDLSSVTKKDVPDKQNAEYLTISRDHPWSLIDVVSTLHSSATSTSSPSPFVPLSSPSISPTSVPPLLSPTPPMDRSVRCTLSDCLDEFSVSETLSEEEKWVCPQCREPRPAIKRLDVWRCPDILIIHLKRFVYTSQVRSKLTAFVDFPSTLDMAPWVADPSHRSRAVYELFAVTHHVGALGSGHYTASIRHLLTGEWYRTNDTSVSQLQGVDEVKDESAYVLFYARRGRHVNIPAQSMQ